MNSIADYVDLTLSGLRDFDSGLYDSSAVDSHSESIMHELQPHLKKKEAEVGIEANYTIPERTLVADYVVLRILERWAASNMIMIPSESESSSSGSSSQTGGTPGQPTTFVRSKKIHDMQIDYDVAPADAGGSSSSSSSSTGESVGEVRPIADFRSLYKEIKERAEQSLAQLSKMVTKHYSIAQYTC